MPALQIRDFALQFQSLQLQNRFCNCKLFDFTKFYKILQNYKMIQFTPEFPLNIDSEDDSISFTTASAIDEIDYPEILRDHGRKVLLILRSIFHAI